MKRSLTKEENEQLADTLIELYYFRRMNIHDMSKIMNYSERTIIMYLSKNKITRSGYYIDGVKISLDKFKRLSDDKLYVRGSISEKELLLEGKSLASKENKPYVNLGDRSVFYQGAEYKIMNEKELRKAFIKDGILNGRGA